MFTFIKNLINQNNKNKLQELEREYFVRESARKLRSKNIEEDREHDVVVIELNPKEFLILEIKKEDTLNELII